MFFLVLISCSSRLLSSAESNYSIVKKEALAVVWGVTHYRPYLFGRNFLVITDHKSLQYLYNFKDPNGRLVQWILALQEYDFDVKYRSGNLNTFADALSRLPVEEQPNSLQTIEPILDFDEDFSDICSLEEIPIEDILPKIAEEQLSDPFCRPIREYLEHNILPQDSKTITNILFHSKYMVVDNNVLYNLWYVISDKRMRKFIKQVVVPASLQKKFLNKHTATNCSPLISVLLSVTKISEPNIIGKICSRILLNSFLSVKCVKERKILLDIFELDLPLFLDQFLLSHGK